MNPEDIFLTPYDLTERNVVVTRDEASRAQARPRDREAGRRGEAVIPTQAQRAAWHRDKTTRTVQLCIDTATGLLEIWSEGPAIRAAFLLDAERKADAIRFEAPPWCERVEPFLVIEIDQ